MATLSRPRDGRVIAGVCAALARRFRLPVNRVRVVFVLFGLFGAGELAYIAVWILVPNEDDPRR